jgi:hypothetical protein
LRARRNIGWNRFDLPTSGLDLTMRHIESRAKQAMTFQPGQSGNPGGRRRKSDDDRKVEELARAYGVEAIKTLASIMRSAKAPASARSAAAQAILDRGFGRPRQTHDVTTVTNDFAHLSDAELNAQIRKEVAELGLDKDEHPEGGRGARH